MVGTPGRSGGNRFVGQLPAAAEPVSLPKPDGLSLAASEKWDSLMCQIDGRVLSGVDVHQLAVLARLLADSDTIAALLDADPEDHKARRAMVNNAQSIGRLSAQFGLSPIDRARLKVPEPEGPDPFAEFLKQQGGQN